MKIKFTEINYIESLVDYLKIFIPNKTILTRETLSNIEAKLPQEDFIRIHRSFIVSYHGINSFTNEYVEVGERMIPISRSYKSSVLKRLEG